MGTLDLFKDFTPEEIKMMISIDGVVVPGVIGAVVTFLYLFGFDHILSEEEG